MEPYKPVGPFIRQWDGYDHIHFANWAVKTFSQDKNDTHRRHKNRNDRYHKWHLAYRIFRVGRAEYLLDKNMTEFWEWIEPTPKPYYNYPSAPQGKHWNRWKKRYVNAKYEDWYPRKGAHFRQKIPLKITEKKVVSQEELQKREWKKSKSRNQTRHWWSGKSKKRWAKHFSNRFYRQHERQLISQEQYEDLFKTKRKDYWDSWDWD